MARAPQGVDAPGRASITARTLRKDKWWQNPMWVAIGLSTWVLYALFRTVWQEYYFVEEYHYLSPFSSPCVSASCAPGSQDFGIWFSGEWPPLVPFAIFVLPFLLGFRLTCYYYRKAYYRAFWRSPVACAVPEPHKKYTGETRFPLIFQNAHRYFFYAAIVISAINTYDAILAFHSPTGFGIGLGTIIMVVNVVMLWTYTLSCHSCRHIVGGQLRHFSRHPVRYKMWVWVSKINGKHMQLAWITLGTLALTDMYIWFVSAGLFNDPRIIG